MADDAGTVPCSIPWLNPWLSEEAGIAALSPPTIEPELISGVVVGASPSLLDVGTPPCSCRASSTAEVVSSQFTKAKAHATTMLVNILDFISCLLILTKNQYRRNKGRARPMFFSLFKIPQRQHSKTSWRIRQKQRKTLYGDYRIKVNATKPTSPYIQTSISFTHYQIT